MFREGLVALRTGRSTLFFPHLKALKRKFSSKESSKPDANRLAKDAGKIAQQGTKAIAQVFEDLTTSNEVKLVRLSAIRVYEVSRRLFDKHIAKNPDVKAFLGSFNKKASEASAVAGDLAKQVQKLDLKKTDSGKEKDKGTKTKQGTEAAAKTEKAPPEEKKK